MNQYHQWIVSTTARSSLRQLAALVAVAGFTLLSACSGGAATTANPVTTVAQAATYSGPPPATADVQAFMVNVWANIKATNRCGGCHTQGGQSPQFARSDDVNMAYQAANTVVNLSQPDQSTMVQKVSGGHNCWLASPSACGDTLTVWIQNWAGSTATGSAAIKLVAPPNETVGSSKTFPISPATFQSTIYPIVTQWCSRCHAPTALTPQQPYFASADVNEAYADAQAKINLADANPANANPAVPCVVTSSSTTCLSRFIARLDTDHHNCWSDCTQNAQTMLTAIENFADPIPLATVDPSLVISKALTMYDGTVASGQNRYTTSQIALYEFKTGTGTIAYDTSGVEPELDLNLTGNYTWDAGWGVVFAPGSKAQGTTTTSQKLYNMITSTGEFSIEAWVSPANVAQTGANIVSYSGGPKLRDATLSQNAMSYAGNVRSSVTDTNGAPALVTSSAAMLAQAALQHVVLTYDAVNGRKLYIDGVYSGDVDASGGGTLANWDNTFALVVGNETSGTTNQFQGELRMVAIHNRALTLAQIQQNYAAGVGQKYFMLFDVSALSGVPQSYIMMTLSLNDSYSYMFTNPTFISLDPTQTPNGIPISGIRIGINGTEPTVGQSYIPLNTTVTTANYSNTSGQLLSSVGAVIALQNGPAADQFFLSFAQIGSQSHVYTSPAIAIPAPVPGPAEPDLGVRTFERLSNTMAKVTGVPSTDANVTTVYQSVLSALPPVPDLSAYSAANQTAIAQLAVAYCSEMVNTRGKAVFGASFDPTQGGAYFAGAINTSSNRDAVINALYTNLVGGTITVNLATQPTFASVQAELNALITNLTPASYSSTPGRAGIVTTAACAAVLGSASSLVQ
ncbi:MAG TPA: LamG domain-containing protein [Steroidobacteraceae bacterium]|nr:LamG domain-containing protein [Steroidobacteraceae bacterium]